jgi:hypothetical protein
MATAVARTEQSTRAQLLADIRAAFEEKKVDRLSSEDLTNYLIDLDGRWADWKGKPLSKAVLARLLSPFGILSGTIRLGGQTAKGYYHLSFKDAFERYLPLENVAPSQRSIPGECDAFEGVTTLSATIGSKPSQAQGNGHGDVVTFPATAHKPLVEEIAR